MVAPSPPACCSCSATPTGARSGLPRAPQRRAQAADRPAAAPVPRLALMIVPVFAPMPVWEHGAYRRGGVRVDLPGVPAHRRHQGAGVRLAETPDTHPHTSKCKEIIRRHRDILTLVYLEEKDTSFECCVGLIVDPSSIAHLLQHPGLTDHYLVQEDLTIEGSDSEELHVGDHVHLVLSLHIGTRRNCVYFPGQNLLSPPL